MSQGTTKARNAIRKRAAASGRMLLARAVARTQVPVIDQIEAQGATVRGSVRNVLNAIFVQATPQQAKTIESMTGVRSVAPSQHFSYQLDAVAQGDIVRLSAARMRNGQARADGEGIRIAVIDSGLDFNHEAFQDVSLDPVPGYPKGRPEHLHLANNKIIAVRSYMYLQNSGQPETSTPDDETPHDSSGHGTAVAMIAAGKRVMLPGNRAVEGVAPKAYLGVYKVSGTPAIHPGPSSQAVIAAIDDAVTDGMDILNISLGIPALYPWQAVGTQCGSANELENCDPLAIAAQSAVVDFGRVVVAAAGNAGDAGVEDSPAAGTISSPAIAPDVIAVGATVNARRLVQSVRAGTNTYAAMTGTGPSVDGQLTAPAALAATFGDRFGCTPYPQTSLDRRLVVIERGTCWFVEKVEHAHAAGAAGAVIYGAEESEELLEMASLDETDIPAYFVKWSDGRALVQSVTAAPELRLTLDSVATSEPTDWLQVADFSARGPTPGLNLKPDIAAPGELIYTATARHPWRQGAFRPSGFQAVSGTSLAAPFVAGAAALVWQKHPDYTVREVASALINTASQAVMEEGETARVGSVGGGLLDIDRAMRPIATVEPPTVGFEVLASEGLPIRREIRITNRSGTPRAYDLQVVTRDVDTEAILRINGSQHIAFGLRANEYLDLQITLQGRRPAPGSYEGHLRLSLSNGGDFLRIPYLYAVGEHRPANGFALIGGDEYGLVGQASVQELVGKYVDRQGVPVVGAPIRFIVREGTANVLAASAATDRFGLASAEVRYSGRTAHTLVVASAGGFEIPFRHTALAVRPRIDSVTNLALYEGGHSVAPGSIIAIEGSGFAEFAGAARGSPVPLALKSASVSFDFPELGISAPGNLLFADRRQLNVQVPWELAGLNFAYLKVRVRTKEGAWYASDPLEVQLADVAPGILSYRTATGQLSPELWHADGRPLTVADPARPGEVVVATMTGNGPLASPVPSGHASEDYVRTKYGASATVGGMAAEVEYSGALPGAVGLYQLDFVVPSGIAPGNANLHVRVHGAQSNIVKLPVR